MKKLLTIFLLICLLTSPIWSQWPYQQKPMLGWQINGAHQLGDPAALWLFNEGSGYLQDLSGNGILLDTFVNSPTWVLAKYGSGIDFERGSTQGVTGTKNALTGTPLTMVAWVKLESLPSDYGANQRMTSVGVGDTDTLNFFFLRADSENDRVQMHVRDDGTANLAESIASVEVGKWQMWAGVCFSPTSRFAYLDGIRGSENTVEITPTNLDNSSIGLLKVSSGAFDHMDGVIDHVMIWNRALSDSEITKLLSQPFCMFAEDNIPLMAQEAPAPTGGQVISIQLTAIPLLVFFLILIRLKHEK